MSITEFWKENKWGYLAFVISFGIVDFFMASIKHYQPIDLFFSFVVGCIFGFLIAWGISEI